jgi:hypothetical protein
MLLKTRTCGKNEPENEAGHVVENKRRRKSESNSRLKGFLRKDILPQFRPGPPELTRKNACMPQRLCAAVGMF